MTLAAVKKVLPKSGRIRLISGDSKMREEDDDNVDLRDLLNRSRDTKKEKCVCACACVFAYMYICNPSP